MSEGGKFSYTYSAPTELQRREVEGIKKQYEAEPAGDENSSFYKTLTNLLQRLNLKLAKRKQTRDIIGVQNQKGDFIMENQKNYVEQIKDGYVPRERTKLDELRELDRKVRLPAVITVSVIGVIAALVFGVGMCLAMQVIGASVLAANVLTALGVVVGVAGMGLGVADYFIYKAVLKKGKAKYGERIIKLSDEILNN